MHSLALFFSLLFSLSTLSISEPNQLPIISGFSIDLIHRDSPLSPFYNSSMTPSQLLTNAAFRSISRSNRFPLSMDHETKLSDETDIAPSDGDYLMKIFIGTPPVETLAVADTGSNLVWVQCSPCVKCYPQKNPLFDPKKSSSYKVLSCDSKPCTLLPNGQSTCGNSKQCLYSYEYGDESYTAGELAEDYINFGGSTKFPKVVFGCGRNNVGLFSSNDAGIVGLGGGSLSLVSQLGDEIGGRIFSYCLLPFSSVSTSKLKFGEAARTSGHGVVSSPLLTKPGAPSAYYFLNLEGISVGQKTASTGQSDGNIFIDSAATITRLESSFYNKVEDLVKEAIGIKAVQNPPGNFRLCYSYKSASSKNFPDFEVHFKGGAHLSLKRQNLFVPIDDLLCFAVFPRDGVSIYGNLAQINFQVEYDLDGRKVSFAPSHCSEQSIDYV